MAAISIRAITLPKLLDIVESDERLEYLSLDCFDTLLWRNTQAPRDLFADLPIKGGAMSVRRRAESNARLKAPHSHGRFEVTLDEIHAELLPGGSADERAAMVQAELDAEAQHCFAFGPTRDLMVAAKERGLKIIVVSDTYLTEERLRNLIATVGGEDLAAMIDRIFCSCEYGIGKSGGLLKTVLEELGADPDQLLHIGDNMRADLKSARKLGIPSLHLAQFDVGAQQRLRMEAAAAAVVDPQTRISFPAYQPQRAAISLRTNEEPVFAFGHDVLGPVMHGFASWIRDEAQAMEKATGRKVKLLFLQRDGHLPARAFRQLYPEWADRVSEPAMSRAIATAAGLVDKAAVQAILAPWFAPHTQKTVFKLEILARRLLFKETEIAELLKGGDLGKVAARMMEPQNLSKILKRSKAMAQRMFRHMQLQGIEKGDAVMLIDLGYNGTVQNAVEARLRKGYGLEVAGRYLLLRENVPSGLDKKGYFDARNYDYNMLTSIFANISILEQFCTMSVGSAIDFEMSGEPIRDAVGVENAQSDVREQAQEACLAYLDAFERAFVRLPRSHDADTQRKAAMGTLARLLMMPVAAEVEMLKSFSHDANFGADVTLQMSDLETGAQSIKRRGFSYLRNARRMYLPGELHQFGLPLNLSMFSMRRLDLDFAKGDIDPEVLELPIQVYGGGESTARTIGAHRTADGFFRAIVPIGKGEYTIGLFLGRLFEYVQFEEISFQPVEGLNSENVTKAQVVTDGMEEVSPGLYRVDTRQGFMIVPAVANERQMLLSLVLRPVVLRKEEEQEAEERQVA